MVLRIRPDLPVLWRSPTSVQVGVSAVVATVEEVVPGAERLLAALESGVSRSGFDMLARSSDVPPADAERLLADLAPALHPESRPPAPRVAVLGSSPPAREIALLLDDAVDSPEAADLVVLCADWVVDPADHGTWLRRDRAHLPVVLADRAIVVGPLVEPGVTPCLYCVHLARTDADPAWPAIATQLWRRPPAPVSRLAVVEASAFAVRTILRAERSASSTSWRFDADGAITASTWARHPECSCAAPPGSGSAPAAAPAIPARPRRTRAGSAPA